MSPLRFVEAFSFSTGPESDSGFPRGPPISAPFERLMRLAVLLPADGFAAEPRLAPKRKSRESKHKNFDEGWPQVAEA